MNKYLQQVQDPNVVTCFKLLFEALADERDNLNAEILELNKSINILFANVEDLDKEIYTITRDTTKLEKEVHAIRSTEYYD